MYLHLVDRSASFWKLWKMFHLHHFRVFKRCHFKLCQLGFRFQNVPAKSVAFSNERDVYWSLFHHFQNVPARSLTSTFSKISSLRLCWSERKFLWNAAKPRRWKFHLETLYPFSLAAIWFLLPWNGKSLIPLAAAQVYSQELCRSSNDLPMEHGLRPYEK